MRNSAKVFGAMFASFGVFALFCAASFADATPRSTDSGRSTSQYGRMPSMPIMKISPMAINTNNYVASEPQPQPQPQPDPKPEPEPQPQPEPEPQPVPECPDGGVRNSDYTVTNCMNEVLACVNNGALANGLNDLFNEDMRNAIVNGMGLCSAQVEKCMVQVRRDCKPVYRAIADVWVDFNSRKVQPEYYNFVLRKTGLTPNQAENTCLLLDRNTYGTSFNAIATSGATTAEYNKRIGAYNGQEGGMLIKNNPMGARVNHNIYGVDGERGHYARWDATTATCYLRVAAYNKDTQIKNSWLFGALGNDDLAEVWRPAGDTFSCNKDLFGFSLMNDTKTTAVVGIGGGTLAGAGIGALAGHGKRAFDCNNASARKSLNEQLRGISDSPNRYLLNAYLDTDIKTGDLTRAQCEALVDLYVDYETVKESNPGCFGDEHTFCDLIISEHPSVVTDLMSYKDKLEDLCDDTKIKSVDDCANFLESMKENAGLKIDREHSNCSVQKIGCDVMSLRNADSLFSYLKCDNIDGGCASEKQTQSELEELGKLFKKLSILQGEGENLSKTIPIGAAIGAGTGGLATAITAFVERNNITCRVGDGLEQVAVGKSHSISTLKDFYVKWNLRLPDTISPTSTAVDCKSWKLACAQYTDLNQCKKVSLNYKPDLDGTITLVRSACDVSGSVCIENAAVAKSYGACAE